MPDGPAQPRSSAYARSPRHTLRVPVSFPRDASWRERIEYAIAICAPVGLIPWVPATWTSLLVALACWGLRDWLSSFWVLALTALITLLGGRTASTAERLLASEDPRNVVIDEVAGQLLTFLLVPAATFWLALLGFALFRAFDVTKPWPARRLEALHSGWGIMADDLAAGLYAALSLWLLVFAFYHWR